MTNPEISPDVTVLMPKIVDWERTNNRYAGLFDALGQWGLSAMLVTDMNHTYSEERLGFEGGYSYSSYNHNFTPDNRLVRPGLVRDLTMAVGDRAIYRNPEATFVHQPAFNAVLANRATVQALLPSLHPDTYEVNNGADIGAALELLSGRSAVVKPVVASEAENKKIFLADKEKVAEKIAMLGISRPLLVQGFVETDQGIPELRIVGQHLLRVIMIGGRPIFASSTSNAQPNRPPVFYWPAELPSDVSRAIHEVHDSLVTLPDGINTVVAAEFKRGHEDGGEERVYLEGLYRKPLRVSGSLDNNFLGSQWAARRWDKHEAELLHTKFSA